MSNFLNDPLHSPCPAQKDWWDPEVFRPYYLQGSKNYDPESIVTPADTLNIKKDVNNRRYTSYSGFIWKISSIKIHWSQGPIAFTDLSDIATWDHWHTSFHLHSHIIHIDFISFFRGGPQTAYREYRVFNDNCEIGRGGGFAGFLGGNFKKMRNWPLAVEIEDHLIYFQKPMQIWYGARTKGVIDEKNPCSIWIRISTAEE
jgi:hypothetical protein